MNSAPFGEVWLTADEIVALKRGVGKRKVLLNISSGKWPSRESDTRLGNGKRTREVALANLPEGLRQLYVQAQVSGLGDQVPDDQHGIDNIDLSPSPVTQPPTPDADRELRLTQALQRLPLEVRGAFLDEARRLSAIVERYILLPSKRVRISQCEIGVRDQVSGIGCLPVTCHSTPDTRYTFTPAVLALCNEAACTNPIIIEYYRSRQHAIRKGTPRCARLISGRTLDDWSRRLRKQGLVIFLPAPPAKATAAGDERLAKMPQEAYEWLLKNWKNHPTVTQCYYRWEKAARKKNWRIPSARWLTRWYQDIPTVAKAAIFLGEKVYTDKYKPFLPRTVVDLEPLQLLCGDHHVLDVLCWSEEKKALVRLWLTAWLDLRTYLLYGMHLDYTPSSNTIGWAYANGVRMFGAQPPRRSDGFRSLIYVDNGKDYRSRNVDGHLEVHRQAARVDGGLELLLTDRGVGLTQDADIETFLARKYNGREKPLERVFRDLADYLQNEFFRTGWCGRNTKDRPSFFNDLYSRHVKAIKAGRPSPFPLEPTVRRAVAEFYDKHNTTAHMRTVLGGASTVPLQEYQSLYTTRYEIREETLALMVMKATSGSLEKNGVRALGSHYWHDELSRFKGRKDKDGKPVRIEVRYTDADFSTAWLVLPDGALVESMRVDISSILVQSKEGQKGLAERVRGERDLIKRAAELKQSIWRGETTEDRFVAECEPVEERVLEAVAVGGGGGAFVGGQRRIPSSLAGGSSSSAPVQLIGRLDKRRMGAPRFQSVSLDHVADTVVDESIFGGDDEGRGNNVVRMWEDDED